MRALAVATLAAAATEDCLQPDLLFGSEFLRARHEYVCCHNEKWAEPKGSLVKPQSTLSEIAHDTIFYDAQCGIPLFKLGARSFEDWWAESERHGWPSFRPDETIGLGTNVLEKGRGELVSSCGTHLGHNLPDLKGDRFCINMLCIAGTPHAAAANGTTVFARDPRLPVDDPANLATESARAHRNHREGPLEERHDPRLPVDDPADLVLDAHAALLGLLGVLLLN